MEQLDNIKALEDLKKRRVDLEKQLDLGREMYLKIVGAIEVLSQIEQSKAERKEEVLEEKEPEGEE
tara:strand:+ start:434 stop:631 length:198 start_codon:yes stop_codon:yes gene_type:complete